MSTLNGAPSRLIAYAPNIAVTVATPLFAGSCIVDYVSLVNNDTAANALRLFLTQDGGATWLQFFRANAVAAAASTFAQFGGMYFKDGIAAAPNGVTTTGMAAFLFGWPIW